MSVSQTPDLRRSWTGRKIEIFAIGLAVSAIAFGIFGPDYPKGITLSGPLTTLVIAFIVSQIGYRIQLYADLRYCKARNAGRAPAATEPKPEHDFDDDPFSPVSSSHATAEPSADMEIAWAQRLAGRL